MDVYAVVVLYSAMLVRIEKRKLASMCLIFAGWQMLAVLVGTLITYLPFYEMVSTQGAPVGCHLCGYFLCSGCIHVIQSGKA